MFTMSDYILEELYILRNFDWLLSFYIIKIKHVYFKTDICPVCIASKCISDVAIKTNTENI